MDPIAKEYYRIVDFYQELVDDLPFTYIPFTPPPPFEVDENIIHVAETFYESVKYKKIESKDVKKSKYILKLIEQQEEGISYLKQNITEALLSDDHFIREIAKLIYQDVKNAQNQKPSKN